MTQPLERDVFENWKGNNVFDLIPWAEDNKSVDELIEEFKKGMPPQKRGRRVPFALYHTIQIENKGNVKSKKNSLMVLDLSGSHGQESMLDYYHKKFQGLLYWWFPTNAGPTTIGNDAKFSTTIEKQFGASGKAAHYAKLENHCRYLAGMNHKAVNQLEVEKNELARRVKELEAKVDADKNSKSSGTNKREAKAEAN